MSYGYRVGARWPEYRRTIDYAICVAEVVSTNCNLLSRASRYDIRVRVFNYLALYHKSISLSLCYLLLPFIFYFSFSFSFSASRICISCLSLTKWLIFYRVLSLSVSIYYKVRNPWVLQRGNLIVFIYSVVKPYFCRLWSILRRRYSLVGLSSLLTIKLFLRRTSTFLALSSNTLSR